MKLKSRQRPVSTTVLYTFAAITALSAVALLINNVLLFRDTIAQYVAQGYPYADVFWGLLPGQLLPGVFQPIAVYGGISALLFGAGLINHKLTKGLEQLTQAAAATSYPVDEVEVVSESSVGTEEPLS